MMGQRSTSAASATILSTLLAMLTVFSVRILRLIAPSH
jgi:hypothetical protein